MASTTKVTMKLLIDTERDRVLFAEASKEVVDFLFNLLQLPLATVIRLLTKEGMVGCLGNLYGSVEALNDTYLQPDQSKDVLLKPTLPSSSTAISGLLLSSDCNQSTIPKLYMCCSCSNPTVTEVYNSHCTRLSLNHYMTREVTYISKIEAAANSTSSATSNTATGFVKDVVTYMVMDDLVIQPLSTISSITLLNKFNVKEVGSLKEKVVELGMPEGINILKASLQSDMVLTTVFMKNKESSAKK